ncbi:MAG: type II toxin-antitoxin system death-on-curing family toxin [Myxococcota bacterium]|nr:type II toxin-antitoxin system death-on-curing family toxin [Myxococcota bacterium]MDW8363960.1 type II toxin-antitoxin system death-on-curing family toxin [Myxococcales bacterium]
MREPKFLTVEDVLILHREQSRRYGGSSAVRAIELLESAVAQAPATFAGEYLHADLFEMAAAYAFHIAQNQPFIDGNKRTGLLAALVFLDLNDVIIRDDLGELHDAMIAIAERRMDKATLASVLRKLEAGT